MKKKNWIYLVLAVLCLVLFGVYRIVGAMSADHQAPRITVSDELLEVSVKAPKSALLKGVSAQDDRDGDVTASLVVESMRLLDKDGTVAVTYAAFDKAGNVAKAQRNICFHDYESPDFSLNAPLAFVQNTNFDVLSVISSRDVFDGDIQHRIRATSLDNASITLLGNHYVQFRVTNSLGDTVEVVLPVEVYPTGIYEAELTLTQYLIYLPVGANFRAEDYLGEFTLNRETVSLRTGLPEYYSLRTSGWVDTRFPGVYSLGYTVTYTEVNERNPEFERQYDGYSRLIIIVEG